MSTNTNSLVTVVIVNRNYGHFVGSAIESVLGQTYEAIELIVVDDHSSDHSQDVIATFLGKYKFISLQSKGYGVSAARNEGLRNAHGDYIAFLDSDDYFTQDKIRLQIEDLNKFGLDAITSDVLLSSQKTTGSFTTEFKVAPLNFNSFLVSSLGVGGYLMSTLVFKKSVLSDITWFDELLTHGEDYDFASRIYAKFKVGHISKALTTIRKHGLNSSTAPSVKFQKDVMRLNTKFIKAFSNNMSRIEVLNYIFRSFYGAMAQSIKTKNLSGFRYSILILSNIRFIFQKR
jgi:glycosyltransferase involved in cell wall biosynthesis